MFAKGILEDSGFAWRVVGSVRGYSSNRVITQSPAAGTRVVDTGAPTVIVGLVRGPNDQPGVPSTSRRTAAPRFASPASLRSRSPRSRRSPARAKPV